MIIIGDCLEVMKTLDAASIDAIVTDPPYGISFMGKDWDSGVPGVAFWREALRVAKPGCHILAAGGTRTYHRLAVAIEDAGWEIRDCVLWLYGNGFPKSHNVSKAIDKQFGAEREIIGTERNFGASKSEDDKIAFGDYAGEWDITKPSTDEAKQWEGWGTALKPAFEPFVLARKPLDGTVAANVLRHGCGGLNVDGCRVGAEERPVMVRTQTVVSATSMSGQSKGATSSGELTTSGRWPANVIHDGSDEVTQPLGTAARFFYVPKASRSEREAGLDGMEEISTSRYAEMGQGPLPQQTPSKSTKQANHHPTVKPVALMSYLCRLITPPNGTILDPFCGSGSTGVAAIREGFKFVGIELNPDYAEIATRRIDHERQRMPLLEAIR